MTAVPVADVGGAASRAGAPGLPCPGACGAVAPGGTWGRAGALAAPTGPPTTARDGERIARGGDATPEPITLLPPTTVTTANTWNNRISMVRSFDRRPPPA